jgi:hypothetical protein
MILILVWTPPIAFGMDTLRVSECTYHQRSPGTVEGVPLFMDMWRQGCTTISFLQYAENAQVYFQYSPCTSYNLKTWASGTVPAGAQELSSYYQKSWGRWKQTERFQFQENEFWVGRGGGGDVNGTTLWCGEGSSLACGLPTNTSRVAAQGQISHENAPPPNPQLVRACL